MASKSFHARVETAEPNDPAAKAGELLAELARRFGAPRENLLARAATRSTPVSELRRLKDLAKGFLKQADDKAHREAASLLYHVTIAAAFGRHRVEISSRPITERRDLYHRLASIFGHHPIGDVFRDVERAISNRAPFTKR